MSAKVLKEFLGSVAFVRNWHGFGLGQNRSDLIIRDADDDELDAEMRLLRFLLRIVVVEYGLEFWESEKRLQTY